MLRWVSSLFISAIILTICSSLNMNILDALPGIGHACGHNLIATASLAGALATAELMKKHAIEGKVVVFGTPAEEGGGGGKIRLLNSGAYEDHGVQLSLISHPGISQNRAMVRTAAYAQFKVEYFGVASHAANNPWKGINALDALVIAYNALSVLRQQTMPGDTIQCSITDGGTSSNIIHAYSAGTFVIRSNTAARLKELQKRVHGCFDAGAAATGARLRITPEQTYADHIPNKVLAASYVRYWNLLDPPGEITVDPKLDRLRGQINASTDQGNISHAMPSLNASFTIPSGPGGSGPHNPGFATASGTREAFMRCLRTGKALAGTAVDILTEDGLIEAVVSQWKEDVEKSN
jgi:amidohydrolase